MSNIIKLIFIFITVLFLSACGYSQNTYTEKSASEDMSGYSEIDIISRMNAIKEGIAPKIKTKSNSAPVNPKPQQQQNQVQLEPLSEQYNQAVIKTNLGDIKVEFYIKDASLTVNNFLNLAKKGFYNGTKFHRVISDFIIQGGDPNSKDDDWSDDGQGGPDYKFQDEINSHKLVRGSLAMANSGADTNGSQFFIVTAEATPWLDGKHTNFGYVVEGMDVVDKIEAVKTNEQNHPLDDIIVENVELISNDAAIGPEPSADIEDSEQSDKNIEEGLDEELDSDIDNAATSSEDNSSGESEENNELLQAGEEEGDFDSEE